MIKKSTDGRLLARVRPERMFLTEWYLNNFKSAKEAKVKLSPLTIFVGKNSSGKSTLLQSILFMAQNASEPLSKGKASRGLVDLNGALISLGSFADTRSAGAKDEEKIEVGGQLKWSYTGKIEAQLVELADEVLGNEDARRIKLSKPEFSLDWSCAFELDDTEIDSYVISSNSFTSVSVNKHQIQNIRSKMKKSKSNYENIPLFTYEMAIEALTLDGADIYSNENFNDHVESQLSTFFNLKLNKINHKNTASSSMPIVGFQSAPKNLDLVSTNYAMGLPRLGRVETNVLDAYLSRQDRFFNEDLFRYLRFSQHGTISGGDRQTKQHYATVSQATTEYIEAALEEMESIESQEDLPLEPPIDLNLIISALKSETEAIADKSKQESLMVRNKYMDDLVSKWWPKVSYELKDKAKKQGFNKKTLRVNMTEMFTKPRSNIPSTYPIEFGVQGLEVFLKAVSFIFPLREEPRDIYPRSMGRKNPQMPIGMKGELLAQLIYENQTGYFSVPNSNKTRSVSGEVLASLRKPISFKEAMNAWIKNLEIASGELESTLDQHYGYRLTLGGRPLRSWGFGVSQVLPIIALCLYAPPNTLIILKEPELHLNPSLQRSLGDFFVFIVQSGRQIFVETHSEYLITRLRLLSAKEKDVRNLFSLVFTHQEIDPKSGLLNSKYQSVFPDSKGQLPDWPDGFFDQIPQDIQELLGVMLDQKDDNPNQSAQEINQLPE